MTAVTLTDTDHMFASGAKKKLYPKCTDVARLADYVQMLTICRGEKIKYKGTADGDARQRECNTYGKSYAHISISLKGLITNQRPLCGHTSFTDYYTVPCDSRNEAEFPYDYCMTVCHAPAALDCPTDNGWGNFPTASTFTDIAGNQRTIPSDKRPCFVDNDDGTFTKGFERKCKKTPSSGTAHIAYDNYQQRQQEHAYFNDFLHPHAAPIQYNEYIDPINPYTIMLTALPVLIIALLCCMLIIGLVAVGLCFAGKKERIFKNRIQFNEPSA